MKEAQIQENENKSDQNEEQQLNQVNDDGDDDHNMKNNETGQSVMVMINNDDEMEHPFRMSVVDVSTP